MNFEVICDNNILKRKNVNEWSGWERILMQCLASDGVELYNLGMMKVLEVKRNKVSRSDI